MEALNNDPWGLEHPLGAAAAAGWRVLELLLLATRGAKAELMLSRVQ